MNEASRNKLMSVLALAAALLIPALLPHSAHGMYDPKHGRWLQRDPAGVRVDAPKASLNTRDQYRDGMNLHQYVKARPTNACDPSGLSFHASTGVWRGTFESDPNEFWSSFMEAAFHPALSIAWSAGRAGCCESMRIIQIARSDIGMEGWFNAEVGDNWDWHIDGSQSDAPFYSSSTWNINHPTGRLNHNDSPGIDGTKDDFWLWMPFKTVPNLIRMEFETCAVCETGSYKSHKVLSCIQWGLYYKLLQGPEPREIYGVPGYFYYAYYTLNRYVSVGQAVPSDPATGGQRVEFFELDPVPEPDVIVRFDGPGAAPTSTFKRVVRSQYPQYVGVLD